MSATRLRCMIVCSRQHFAYGGSPDIADLAAIYSAGVVRNHPFVDVFLELNRFRFNASEEAATEAVVALAAGELDEKGYRDFLRANVEQNRQGM